MYSPWKRLSFTRSSVQFCWPLCFARTSESFVHALCGGTNGFGGFVWLYVAAAGLVGVVVYSLMPETAGRELT